MLELRNNDLILREFNISESEFQIYISWVRDIKNVQTIGRLDYLLSMDYQDIREYVSGLKASKNDSFFAVYYKDIFVGTFKIGHIDWHLGIGDVGIMIGNEQYRGKGLSSQIIALGIDYSFDVLGLRKLSGGCYSTNINMRKCFERNGFVQEGELRQSLFINGEYCSHILYGLLSSERIIEKNKSL